MTSDFGWFNQKSKHCGSSKNSLAAKVYHGLISGATKISLKAYFIRRISIPSNAIQTIDR